MCIRDRLKDPRSDQLLAMVGPGMMLWAPREYELFRLAEGGQAEQLLWRYLQQAPVSEAFVWRRWLYLLWDEVDSLVNTGRFDRTIHLIPQQIKPAPPDKGLGDRRLLQVTP